jgi:hypothetical protein
MNERVNKTCLLSEQPNLVAAAAPICVYSGSSANHILKRVPSRLLSPGV